MTVDISSMILETVQPPASVDIAAMFMSTANPLGGSATVDIADMLMQTDPPAAGSATVQIAAMYFAVRGSTAGVSRWIMNAAGHLMPIVGVHFAATSGLVQ